MMAVDPRARTQASDVVTLTERLVRIPSENPPGATQAVGLAVAEELSAGFDVEIIESEPDVVSVLATKRFSETGPALILCGHIDVVPVDADRTGWTTDPWGATTIDGKLYGRGSLDMKGALAGLMTAAKIAAEDGDGLHGQITIAAVADEESGGHLGAGALVNSGRIAGDGVIVAEPSNGGICLAHRGMCFVEVITRGKATHASTPESGVNAVALMIDVLTTLRELELRHEHHPLLGTPTIALGTTIDGGTRPNVVPDTCRATIDVRKLPGMTDETVLSDIQACLTARCLAETELRVVSSGEPAETNEDTAIVRAAKAAYFEEFERDAQIRGMPAATDGWWFSNRAGIPTVMALGPGSIEDTHGVDESVDLAELESYTRLYLGIIRRFLAQ
jgi:succinyl-diaminopimelate desuccinylase